MCYVHYLGTINTVVSTECVYTYAHVYMCLHLQQGEGSLRRLVEGGSQEHHLQGGSQQEEGSPGERVGEKKKREGVGERHHIHQKIYMYVSYTVSTREFMSFRKSNCTACLSLTPHICM